MKKILKFSWITILALLALYLFSIVYFRSENLIKENMFYTPTPYDITKIFNQLDSKYLTFISKEDVIKTANAFIAVKDTGSVKLNNTTITRLYNDFIPQSNSEYYIIKPEVVKKTGIFMMGNQFNVFNLLDNLTLLAKTDSIQIFVMTYNGNGFSTGKSDFITQFKVNQAFYNYIHRNSSVSLVAGHSLGSVFATKLAADNKIPTLALLAPASNIDGVISHFKGFSPLWARPYFNDREIQKSEVAKQGNNSENIKNYRGKLILSHGTTDDNLPYGMSEEILKNCPSGNKKLIKIDKGDHYAPLTYDNWEKLIQELN